MMTAQQLKNSILQRAIEGKLVEQRPEEGTAKDLLKEIKLEKEKLVKEGKIKKSRPLPAITEDEIPFEIPDSWEWVRLQDLCYPVKYGTSSKSDKTGKIPVLRMGNIQLDGEISYDDLVYSNDEADIEKYLLGKNDLLFNRTNSRELVGKTAIYRGDIPAIFAGYLIQIKTILASPFYLNCVMNSEYERDYCKRVKSDGINQSNVNGQKIANFCIPLPPLSEQHRIVAKIEELLPLVDQYDKAYSQLTALNKKFPQDIKKSILQYAIVGKLVEQRPEEGTAKELLKEIKLEKEKLVKEGKIKKSKPLPDITEDEIPFEIPESWEWVRWGDLSQSIQYGYNAPAQPSGRIKMVRISDIQDNEVLWDTVPYCSIEDKDIEIYLLQPDDILFARTGGTVGKSYLVDKVPEEAIYAGYLIRTRYSKLLVPRYLKTFMESALYWEQLKNGTIATAQPNCNGKTLANMIIPLPPLSEQQRIVEHLEQLLTLCDKLIVGEK